MALYFTIFFFFPFFFLSHFFTSFSFTSEKSFSSAMVDHFFFLTCVQDTYEAKYKVLARKKKGKQM